MTYNVFGGTLNLAQLSTAVYLLVHLEKCTFKFKWL